MLSVEQKYELEQMWRESNARIEEIQRRELIALTEKEYTKATQIAYLRIEEQKRRDYLAAQLGGLL